MPRFLSRRMYVELGSSRRDLWVLRERAHSHRTLRPALPILVSCGGVSVLQVPSHNTIGGMGAVIGGPKHGGPTNESSVVRSSLSI